VHLPADDPHQDTHPAARIAHPATSYATTTAHGDAGSDEYGGHRDRHRDQHAACCRAHRKSHTADPACRTDPVTQSDGGRGAGRDGHHGGRQPVASTIGYGHSRRAAQPDHGTFGDAQAHLFVHRD